MTTNQNYQDRLNQAECRVKKQRTFYNSCLHYVVICTFLAILNAYTCPGYWWVLWVVAGWGIGIAMQGISLLFNGLWDEEWEKRKVDEIMNRK